ncbi:MAG: protein kinase [Deltaproteobacteria bacterium]|nr:protein kinase [Deltaproteobacteria bacterium]
MTTEPHDLDTVALPELGGRAEPDDPGAPGDEDAFDPDAPAIVEVTAADGLESRVLLARARRNLLGWSEEPVAVGRYRIIERIGTGGMGLVYSAHDDELDRPVAIKILRADLMPGSVGRQRLLREAQATARLSHPNVVHVYEVGQERDQVFMAMELVRGETLRAWRASGKRSWREVLEMYLRAGEGLVAAHAEGIVHRDFKPDNVLVGRDGRPRVLDFGLARAATDLLGTTRDMPSPSSSASALLDVDITRTGTVVGTPAYMAPEQLERAEPDARSDQFSFCVALFEALYGCRPFAGSTYTELTENLRRKTAAQALPRRREVPTGVERTLLRGLEREPDQRFDSMRELLTALRDAATRPGRSSARWLVASAALLAVASAGGYASLHGRQNAAPAELAIDDTSTPSPAAGPDAWAEIVAASDLPPVVAEPLPGDPTGVTLHRLRNGLTVYVVHRPLEPFVSTALIVRAGAPEEGPQQRGIAALTLQAVLHGGPRLGVLDPAIELPQLVLQHTLLEKLPRVEDVRGRDAMLRAVAAAEASSTGLVGGDEYMGASMALGSRDPTTTLGGGTEISIQVPRARFASWAALAAETLQHPNFRNFLGACSEQLEFLGWRTEGSRAYLELDRAIAAATGVLEDPEAEIAKVAQAPLAEVRQFYADYYRPNNTAIVLVGDITPNEALPVIEQYFGAWEPAPIRASPPVLRPLQQPRTVIKVEDAGPPLAHLGWAAPPYGSPEYADLLALDQALPGPGGLLGARFDDADLGGGTILGNAGQFNIGVFPGPRQTTEEAERVAIEGLQAIANDTISEPRWERAMARASLVRNHWARSTQALVHVISESFVQHRPWHDVAEQLAGPMPARERLVAAAKRLLAQGYVVVHRNPGKVWRVEPPALPSLPHEPALGKHSPFAQSLIDAPATPMEPRFLVEGSHFESSPHGKGRVITTRADGPLFRASWVFPVGTREDPWACDAMVAHLSAMPISSIEPDVECSTDATYVDVVGSADTFAAAMPVLREWLYERESSAADVRSHLDWTLQRRGDLRADEVARALMFHVHALRGEHGIDAQMPDDAALRHRGERELPRALHELRQRDPDILYVGPDPAGFRAALPPALGRRGGTITGPRFRELTEPTVFLFDDPHRTDVSIRVALPWTASTRHDVLAAHMHEQIAWLRTDRTNPALEPEYASYRVRWSMESPLAIGLGYRCAADLLAQALDGALAAVRARPNADDFAMLRRNLELDFRSERVPERYVPERVRAWGNDASDPRVAQWLALPSLDADDVTQYYARQDVRFPIVSVVADADTIDLAMLSKYGRIVRVSSNAFIRDPSMSEVGDDRMVTPED